MCSGRDSPRRARHRPDILRQIFVTGIIAVGMTLVIFIVGVNLSLGLVIALGAVICAVILTQEGWAAASYLVSRQREPSRRSLFFDRNVSPTSPACAQDNGSRYSKKIYGGIEICLSISR